MELQQLRYVVAVGRTENFSRAAGLCAVCQPTLSQQIKKLEDELGEKLFDRRKRGAKLTDLGEAFMPHALRILEEVDAAKRESAEAKHLLRGTLTIGVLPTIAPYLLPKVIAQFAKKFSGVEIVVQEDTTSRLTQLALDYEIDFALASHPIQNQRLEVKVLFSEELLLALPLGHSLVGKGRLKRADLNGEALMVMKEGHCLGDQVLEFCDRRDLKPKISFRSSQLETIQALVASGLGISLIPVMAAQSRGSHLLKYRSFHSPKPERKIVMFWPKQRPPGRAASEFVKMLSKRSQAR